MKQLTVGSWQLAVYVVIMAYLFARLDWAVVHYTRTVNRGWLDRMHAHEKAYALVTRTAGLILCTPAMALKAYIDPQVFAAWRKKVGA